MCKCDLCENKYSVDLIVSDELWEKIKPKWKPAGAGLLCASCIMKRIEESTGYAVFYLESNDPAQPPRTETNSTKTVRPTR